MKRAMLLVAATVATLAVPVGAAGAAPTGSQTVYDAPSADYTPQSMVVGPDGRMWAAAGLAGILRMNTDGTNMTQFIPPTANSGPRSIVAAPDGKLWYTADWGVIGRVTTSGTITEFPVAFKGLSMTVGADGKLWFTADGNKIGRITTAGVVTYFDPPTPNSGPWGIAAGDDGNVWFAEANTDKIGRITPSGVITEFDVDPGTTPGGMTAGPDGNLWFTALGTGKIGRMTTAGVVTMFALPDSGSMPIGITAGPDGKLWATEYVANKIARIGLQGAITEYDLSVTNAGPWGLTFDAGGYVWVALQDAHKLVRLSTGATWTVSSQAGGVRTAKVGKSFKSLKVKALDSDDDPVENARVVFRAPETGPRCRFPGNRVAVVVRSNAQGIATAPPCTVRAPGKIRITATIGTANNSVRFNLTAK